MGIPFPEYTGGFTSVVLMGFAAAGYLLLVLLVLALLAGLVRGVAHLGQRFTRGWNNAAPAEQDRTRQ